MAVKNRIPALAGVLITATLATQIAATFVVLGRVSALEASVAHGEMKAVAKHPGQPLATDEPTGVESPVSVSDGTLPALGPDTAPITIVEFSDYQCPFCAAAEPTLQKLISSYPGEIRVVYRDFPLEELHPSAHSAAQAARCANDQGQFWTYHDLLFSGGAGARNQMVSEESLLNHAQNLNLDMELFRGCMDSEKHASAVDRDIEEGRRLGVTGTPTFYINGRPLVGARPLEDFVKIVEEEVAAKP